LLRRWLLAITPARTKFLSIVLKLKGDGRSTEKPNGGVHGRSFVFAGFSELPFGIAIGGDRARLSVIGCDFDDLKTT